MINRPWSRGPGSWRKLPAKQQAAYPNSRKKQLEAVLAELATYPPLVGAKECLSLQSKIAEASVGKNFILQGGDCAERFSYCTTERISRQSGLLRQMAILLAYHLRCPVTPVGRIAGQYAKPRSQAIEVSGDLTLPVYRGDNVNSPELSLIARRPDPERLIKGYRTAALTLNAIRSHCSEKDMDFLEMLSCRKRELCDAGVKESSSLDQYRRILSELEHSLKLMRDSFGVNIESVVPQRDFFISHEGLLLDYESSLTHMTSEGDGFLNTGAHTLWIGERTRDLDGAHVDYFRGIMNPIAVKLGPLADPDEVLALSKVLNPENTPGRLTLVPRMGAEHIADRLPPLIEILLRNKVKVCWSCDPMHGNTEIIELPACGKKPAIKQKTRRFSKIAFEVTQTIQIHRSLGSILGGLHLELTSDPVRECIGGHEAVGAKDLISGYRSACDPRLNRLQSLELAGRVGTLLAGRRSFRSFARLSRDRGSVGQGARKLGPLSNGGINFEAVES